jgi:hypothetical protein
MEEKKRKKLLIIGCGRSGTLYSAEVWRRLGLDIQHERDFRPPGELGKDGFASWFLAVDDPSPPFGPSSHGYHFDCVIHQVRHPLKVIASVAQYILQQGFYSPVFIEKYVPQIKLCYDQEFLKYKDKLVLQAAYYWYHWNLMAEVKSTQTVQVEHLIENLPQLCNMVGIEFFPKNVYNLSSNINARQHHVKEEPWVVTWEDLDNLDHSLCLMIQNLASKYGY